MSTTSPTKARRDAEQAAKFNAGDISKLLASKEPAQSSGSTGAQQNRTASLGTQTGAAQKLSPSMRSQLMGLIREQLEKCWAVPIALQNTPKPPRSRASTGVTENPVTVSCGGSSPSTST